MNARGTSKLGGQLDEKRKFLQSRMELGASNTLLLVFEY